MTRADHDDLYLLTLDWLTMSDVLMFIDAGHNAWGTPTDVVDR
jgi:hypothetical protein